MCLAHSDGVIITSWWRCWVDQSEQCALCKYWVVVSSYLSALLVVLVEESLPPVLDAGLDVLASNPGHSSSSQEVTGRGKRQTRAQARASSGQSHLTTKHRVLVLEYFQQLNIFNYGNIFNNWKFSTTEIFLTTEIFSYNFPDITTLHGWLKVISLL